MPQHVLHVARRPFAEYGAIAVLALGAESPVVERLDHQHHAHLVAELHQFGCRHIVGGADGVGTHILEDFYLMGEGGAVHGGSEGAEVMMLAYPLESGVFSVEKESLLRYIVKASYAEPGAVFIHIAALNVKACARRIEPGSLRAPPLRVLHDEILYERLPLGVIDRMVLGHDVAVRIQDIGLDQDLFSSGCTCYLGG